MESTLKTFEFLVIQTDRYFKRVQVPAEDVESAEAILTDSIESCDLSTEPDIHKESYQKVKYTPPRAMSAASTDEELRKFYVVWVGRVPGVYDSWPECQAQTNGFRKAQFKSFVGRRAADEAFANGPAGGPTPEVSSVPNGETEVYPIVDDAAESPFFD